MKRHPHHLKQSGSSVEGDVAQPMKETDDSLVVKNEL